MSSLTRRLQIRALKRAGYTRNKWILARDPVTREPKIKNVPRGGEITDRDDNPIGRRWPLARGSGVAGPPLLQPGRSARALRRSKRSAQWLKKRAAERRSA